MTMSSPMGLHVDASEETVMDYAPLESPLKSSSVIGRLFEAEQHIEALQVRIDNLQKQLASLADIVGAKL